MARRISLIALTVLFVVALAPAPAQADDAGIHRTGQPGTDLCEVGARRITEPAPRVARRRLWPTGRTSLLHRPSDRRAPRARVPYPARLPIVFSHAAWFTWIPADGSTDAEIIAAAEAGFTPVTTWVRFDGDRVALHNKTFNLGAFTVHSEPGSSFYDASGVGTGPIRTSITATVLTIAPGLCGRHVLRSAVDFDRPGETFSGTYRIRGRCDDE
jgi:hypothetical protein